MTSFVSAQENDSSTVAKDTSDQWVNVWNRIPFVKDTLNKYGPRSLHDSLDLMSGLPWVQYEDTLADLHYRVKEDNNWRFFLLFILLSLVAFARLWLPGILVRYFKAFTSPKTLEELLEDQNSEISGFSLLLTFYYSLLYAFPVQLLLWQMGDRITDYAWGDYSLLAVLIFFYFMAKLFLQAAMGRIFEAKYFTASLFYFTVMLNFMASIVILPIFLIVLLNGWPITTSEVWFYLMIGVVVSGLIKMLRTFLHASSSYAYPRFYLILYLCALEIMPWFVIYKLVEMNLN